MTPLVRVAFIGNSLPRLCGIATFTTDMQQAVAAACPTMETCIIAMTDGNQSYDYPPVVEREIHDGNPADYAAAADFLNEGGWQVVSLQHEFGIFGGESGEYILDLLSRLTMPVVTTLHTVLAQPSQSQRSVMEKIIALSAKVIVMAEKGRQLLRSVYDTPADKIDVIAHGIPDFAFVEPDAAKAAGGFAGRHVVLTFGLLSPNKGIEVMIDAMPAILERSPDTVYIVLGATHPNLVREEGEVYRHRLQARVSALQLDKHVVFLDRFVDLPTLLTFIAMCDVYVTPYLDEAQMTSGTLAYSFGLGKPVVSTPYWHAQELLAKDRGVLVPFGDSLATGLAVADLLTNDKRRQVMRARAYAASRSMTWPRTAERMVAVFAAVHSANPPEIKLPYRTRALSATGAHPPELLFTHLLRMCDDTGLFQHAVHTIPDRLHGYCVDDNCRALLLACELATLGEAVLPDLVIGRFAAFVQHAWNPDLRRFRNFMSFSREWLEPCGSEDSHGRTLWALGVCSSMDHDPSRRGWAEKLFAAALPVLDTFTSPRAWASALLGLDHYCAGAQRETWVREMRARLADRLLTLLQATATPEWDWFEHSLSYDNARLPQALIVTGIALDNTGYIAAGLRSLTWLMARQSTSTGDFRPVGTTGFGRYQSWPDSFDQQPIEATATISACLAAWRSNGSSEWQDHAVRSFAWFHGANELSTSLVDPRTGGCRDGLHPDRVNENQGAESVVCYLMSLVEMRQMALSGSAVRATADLDAILA